MGSSVVAGEPGLARDDETIPEAARHLLQGGPCVFAPNSKLHALVTPTKQGKGNEAKACEERQERMPAIDEIGAARRHPHTEV